mgnify:CR=1 FL=1
MATVEMVMPKMGESITEGTIINWLVEEGASFETGDILVEVATDKVDNEVPAPGDGVMTKHLKGPKEVVPVGEPIAILELKEGSTPVKKSSVKKQQSSSEATKKTIQKQKSMRKYQMIICFKKLLKRSTHRNFSQMIRQKMKLKPILMKKMFLSSYLIRIMMRKKILKFLHF